MGMNSETSTYTISVLELQEYNFDFGLDKYPIFDENYRAILNNAILEFYKFREIGYVNTAVFRQRLMNRMDLIMRNKYNALYSAKAKEFNPLYTMELYEDFSHTVENTGTNSNNGEINTNSSNTNTQNTESNINNTTSSSNNSLGLSSNFPSEEMTEDDLTSNLFVDNANKQTTSENGTDNTQQTNTGTVSNIGNDKTTNTNTGNTTNNTTETYSKKTYGSASDLSFAHAMTQFKEYCDQYNLDQQVIDELKDLFMQVW